MAEKKGFFSKYRLAIRRSSPLLKCMILVVLLLSTVALLTIRSAYRKAEAEENAQRAQAAALEADNHRKEQLLSQLGTIEGIIRYAIQELDLVDPDTQFFTPSN